MKMYLAHPGITKILQLIPKDTKTLLDLGCGKGIIGSLVRIYRNPRKIVGVDIFSEYISFCKKYRIYDNMTKFSNGISLKLHFHLKTKVLM